jgi:C4-dicarboxylate transporter DctQ subunit
MLCIIEAVTAVFMFVIAFQGTRYAINIFEVERTTAALGIPYWIIVAPLPLGFFLGGIEYLQAFIKNITNKEVYISSQLKLGENEEEGM